MPFLSLPYTPAGSGPYQPSPLTAPKAPPYSIASQPGYPPAWRPDTGQAPFNPARGYNPGIAGYSPSWTPNRYPASVPSRANVPYPGMTRPTYPAYLSATNNMPSDSTSQAASQDCYSHASDSRHPGQDSHSETASSHTRLALLQMLKIAGAVFALRMCFHAAPWTIGKVSKAI